MYFNAQWANVIYKCQKHTVAYVSITRCKIWLQLWFCWKTFLVDILSNIAQNKKYFLNKNGMNKFKEKEQNRMHLICLVHPCEIIDPSNSLILSIYADSRRNWRCARARPLSKSSRREVSMGERTCRPAGRKWEPHCDAMQQRRGAEQDQGHHERYPGRTRQITQKGKAASPLHDTLVYGNRPDRIKGAANRLCPNLPLPFLNGLCSCFHALLLMVSSFNHHLFSDGHLSRTAECISQMS